MRTAQPRACPVTADAFARSAPSRVATSTPPGRRTVERRAGRGAWASSSSRRTRAARRRAARSRRPWRPRREAACRCRQPRASFASRTTDSSASRRAMSRCAGGSRSAPARRLAADPPAGPGGDQPGSSRPSSSFCRSTRATARSMTSARHVAGRGQAEQRLAEAAGARQLDVESGGERERRRLARVGGDRVLQLKEGDRVVVGHDHAVEAVLVAQQRGQQAGIGAGRHAVDVDVGRHHRARAAEPDGHLERGRG